jgi:membrane protein
LLQHSRSIRRNASALAVILVWIYYAGMLLLFGAEFTEQYAHARGHPVRPSSNAVSTSPSRTQMHDA